MNREPFPCAGLTVKSLEEGDNGHNKHHPLEIFIFGIGKLIAHVLNIALCGEFLAAGFVIPLHNALHDFNLYLGLSFRDTGGLELFKAAEGVKGCRGHRGILLGFHRRITIQRYRAQALTARAGGARSASAGFGAQNASESKNRQSQSSVIRRSRKKGARRRMLSFARVEHGRTLRQSIIAACAGAKPIRSAQRYQHGFMTEPFAMWL